jgi:hypothetical protein
MHPPGAGGSTGAAFRIIDAGQLRVNVVAIAIARGRLQCINAMDQRIAGAWFLAAARNPPRLCVHGRSGLAVADGPVATGWG